MIEKEELTLNLDKYIEALKSSQTANQSGKVTKVVGHMIEGYLPGACLGSICEIQPSFGPSLTCEVVGFRDRNVIIMPLGEMRGVAHGAKIVLTRLSASVSVGEHLLGRVIDPTGKPLDGKGEIRGEMERPLYKDHSNPMQRPPIDKHLDLGVRAINGLLTIGRGQRIGIMAGSGVGKSVLMGMMAKNTSADVNVIALIGERGREVREFIEKILGPEGMARSIVVVATGDQSPLLRMRGAFVATCIAEFFSELGLDVLFMMDSVTRFAMAQREIGLSAGEPPATKGYTPSVMAVLPKLLERAGTFENKGSITGIYTVLVEGDDMDDPIGDHVRSIVDGHIVLNRKIANKGHFPAIDILQSISRVMTSIAEPEHKDYAQLIKENLAIYRDAEDLINLGAYRKGANPKIDRAIQLHDPIDQFLRQGMEEASSFEETLQQMEQIVHS